MVFSAVFILTKCLFLCRLHITGGNYSDCESMRVIAAEFHRPEHFCMAVYVSSMIIDGAPIEGVNPLPRFRRTTGFGSFETMGDFPEKTAKDLGTHTRTLPYMIQDRYSRDHRKLTVKTVIMENDYLKATFTPEYGGKLWSLWDKTLNRELLFSNPVLQPANLGIRNAWMSGGIEWNFGSTGHTYFTCDNIFAAILNDGSGEQFLRMYEYERAKECIFQMDFHLPKDSRQLFSHIKLFNPNKENRTVYWWTNIAIPEDGMTRILSSSKDVIVMCGGKLSYERLPFLSVMPGDLSYSINATRSFDYFFQPEDNVKTTWEGAVNQNGFTFYDRSTAPLIYHKMFSWGNHGGGKHWQDYLSEPGKGDYIELQAGIGRSQFHDKLFPAGGMFQWTQAYGGTKLDPSEIHDVSMDEADIRLERVIDGLIGENELLELDEKYRKDAEIVPVEENIVHFGSGWGALETEREKKEGRVRLPGSVLFPPSSMGREQKPWLGLLNKGILTPRPAGIPSSWMVSDNWLKLTEESLDRPGGRNWFSLLHYGNMLYEHWDDTKTAPEASRWPKTEQDKYEAMAESAWKESDALRPNVWARRNLAILETERGNDAMAEKYYDSLFRLKSSRDDFCFCAEYMEWLNHRNKYEKSWKLYSSMPEDIKGPDRVSLHAAVCAVKLNMTDLAFEILKADHADIREGETRLTDLWFECSARKAGLSRGLKPEELTGETLRKLIAEAEENCPPPLSIDFRMSYDRNNKYRLSD